MCITRAEGVVKLCCTESPTENLPWRERNGCMDLGEREGRERTAREHLGHMQVPFKEKTNNKKNPKNHQKPNLLLWTENGYTVRGSEIKILVPFFHLNISIELYKSILGYTLLTGGKCCCPTPILEGLLKIFEIYQGKLGLKCLKPCFSNLLCKKQGISGECKNSH